MAHPKFESSGRSAAPQTDDSPPRWPPATRPDHSCWPPQTAEGGPTRRCVRPLRKNGNFPENFQIFDEWDDFKDRFFNEFSSKKKEEILRPYGIEAQKWNFIPRLKMEQKMPLKLKNLKKNFFLIYWKIAFLPPPFAHLLSKCPNPWRTGDLWCRTQSPRPMCFAYRGGPGNGKIQIFEKFSKKLNFYFSKILDFSDPCPKLPWIGSAPGQPCPRFAVQIRVRCEFCWKLKNLKILEIFRFFTIASKCSWHPGWSSSCWWSPGHRDAAKCWSCPHLINF